MANFIYEHAYDTFLDPRPYLTVTDATNATPIVITTSRPSGLTTGDEVTVRNVGGNTAANGIWTITGISDTTFSLDTSVGSGAYTTGGVVLVDDTTMTKLPDVIRWENDDIKAVLVNVSGTGTLYTPDANQDEFLSTIPAGARISTLSGNLSSKTSHTGTGASFVGGVADAANVTFSSVGPSGMSIEAFVLYKDTGDEDSSQLIAYFDTATNLPQTANGGSLTVAFDSGGIFSI